jgi:hypothetical protein
LPKDYRIQPAATELTFPTGVTFDNENRVYVVESGYAYGEVWTRPRLLRVEANGVTEIAAGVFGNRRVKSLDSGYRSQTSHAIV